MTVTLLVKFYNEKKHADKMLDGELLAGRLSKYRDTEDQARRDRREGIILWEQATLTLRTGEGEPWTISPEDLADPMEMQPHLLSKLNVFCMTAFRLDLGPGPSLTLDDQVLQQVKESLPICNKFGDHAVVIADAEEFRRRVTRAAERENWQVCLQRVTYYDSYPLDVAFGKDGRWSFAAAFLKPRAFRLEREFRVAMNTGTVGDNPVPLDIGDIRDIGWHTEARKLVGIIQSAQIVRGT